jgi:hypothetical protein
MFSSYMNITPCSPLKINGRFGETAASILRVEGHAKQGHSINWQEFAVSEKSLDFISS